MEDMQYGDPMEISGEEPHSSEEELSMKEKAWQKLEKGNEIYVASMARGEPDLMRQTHHIIDQWATQDPQRRAFFEKAKTDEHHDVVKERDRSARYFEAFHIGPVDGDLFLTIQLEPIYNGGSSQSFSTKVTRNYLQRFLDFFLDEKTPFVAGGADWGEEYM